MWKVDSKLKSFSLIRSIPALGVVNSLQILQCPHNIVSQFSWQGNGDINGATAVTINGHSAIKQSSPTDAILVAGVGQEVRFGRWVQKKGDGVLNGALVVILQSRTPQSNT